MQDSFEQCDENVYVKMTSHFEMLLMTYVIYMIICSQLEGMAELFGKYC